MLGSSLEQVGALGEAFESVDHEPVLTPENLEVLVPEIIKVSFKLAAVVVDCSLSCFCKIVERGLFRRPGMLSYNEGVQNSV